MNEELKRILRAYLEWRFRVFNSSKYYRYVGEWVDGVMKSDVGIDYYLKEREHLIEQGIMK